MWLRGLVQASADRETDRGREGAAPTFDACPVTVSFLVVRCRTGNGLVVAAVQG